MPSDTCFDITPGETLGWVGGPNYRDTLSIITSCIVTMALCVWSALHLNIPSHRDGLTREWLRNVKWMLVGVFGPELVVFAAWRQYVSARAMQDLDFVTQGVPQFPPSLTGSPRHSQMSERKYEAPNTGPDPQSHNGQLEASWKHWTLIHGFYSAMGGFVFDLDEDTAEALCLPRGKPHHLTVTPWGVAVLAECGVLPVISRGEIKDKSKADGLAKGVVIVQATWILLQTIARICYGLSVTLLEVNTVGHIVCAMTIYAFWWHKPRLIAVPTPISAPQAPGLAAFLWMSSRMSTTYRRSWWNYLDWAGPSELSRLRLHQSKLSPLQDEKTKITFGESKQESNADDATPDDDSQQIERLPSYCALQSTHSHWGSLGLQHSAGSVVNCSWCDPEPGDDFLGGLEAARHRWTLALGVLQEFPVLRERARQLEGKAMAEVLVQDRAINWPTPGLLTGFSGVVMGMALWLASIGFGAVHAAAWHDYFPTDAEKLLWRASSLYIMASGLLWLLINFLGQAWPSFDKFWDRIVGGKAHIVVYVFLAIVCGICGLAYCLARLFLVAESIASLRKMPVSMYKTPNWSLLIPHI